MPVEHQFNDRLIRFPELEKIFGVCKRTVRRRAENGELPPLRHIGRENACLRFDARLRQVEQQ